MLREAYARPADRADGAAPDAMDEPERNQIPDLPDPERLAASSLPGDAALAVLAPRRRPT